jgi:hypothetical protein
MSLFLSIMASNASERTRTERPMRTKGNLPSASIRRTDRTLMFKNSATSAAVRRGARERGGRSALRARLWTGAIPLFLVARLAGEQRSVDLDDQREASIFRAT